MAVANLLSGIEYYTDELRKVRKDKAKYSNEKEVYWLEERRYKAYYQQIHDYLAPKGTEQAEKEIREHIRTIITLDLEICRSKRDRCFNAIEVYEKRKDTKNQMLCFEYFQKWRNLYEQFFALAAYRSLEHFALFMEWDKPIQDKMWEHSIDTFNDGGYSGCTKGFFFYANKMVLSDDINYIQKQLPTNYGKSYSDSTMIAFIFGIDKNEQIVKVVGNNSLPPKCTTQVVNIMASKRYLQVFPEYGKLYDGTGDIKDYIFDICRIKDGMLTIKGSSKDTNFECFSKECKRDGIRCGYLFLDDIVQKKEMLKLEKHKEDMADFDGTWKKRCRDEYHFKIIVGGTTYDAYDLLCELKFRYSGGKLYKSKVNKWTTTNEQGNAVFVCVPKLDENDQLTFPQKCKLENVLADRKNNPDIFYAMDMQQPVVPKEYTFYWDYLLQYDYIPSDCTDYCQAVLDPARTGKNFVSMPICKVRKETLKDGTQIDRHYLVSCFYQKLPMDEAYGKICDLIEEKHIVKLLVEKNTDTSLKFVLDKMLHERGVMFCEIKEVYSSKNKEDRIYADESLIKNCIVYPKRDMYSVGSEMGQFMNHIISYKYTGSDYDDSIDSIGLYCDEYIKDKNSRAKVRFLQL